MKDQDKNLAGPADGASAVDATASGRQDIPAAEGRSSFGAGVAGATTQDAPSAEPVMPSFPVSPRQQTPMDTVAADQILRAAINRSRFVRTRTAQYRNKKTIYLYLPSMPQVDTEVLEAASRPALDEYRTACRRIKAAQDECSSAGRSSWEPTW